MVSNHKIAEHLWLNMDFQSYWKYLILIETRSRRNKFLFDTGVSKDGIVNNSDVLGINLADVETIILSHGHFDHISGLMSTLKKE